MMMELIITAHQRSGTRHVCARIALSWSKIAFFWICLFTSSCTTSLTSTTSQQCVVAEALEEEEQQENDDPRYLSLQQQQPQVTGATKGDALQDDVPEDEKGRRVYYFDKTLGGVPFNSTDEMLRHNTLTLSRALTRLGSNATIIFPADQTYYLYNGVQVHNLHNAVLQFDGELRFKRAYDESFLPPREGTVFEDEDHPPACFHCEDCSDITLTSSLPNGKRGIINGGGPEWWGIPLIGYLQIHERRPFLFLFNGTRGLNIDNLVLQDSPFYNLQLTNVDHVEIHSITIVSRRTQEETHSIVDLSAFNTDGIDIAGHHVHVHDVDIWNQDDCIAIKDNEFSPDRTSSNMTFERIYASGVGLTIGSISGTIVRDIVFQDSYMFKTFKGIYMKFRAFDEDDIPIDGIGSGVVENIHYENITMDAPIQWPIWIGPAQQVGGTSSNLCHASPCSLCWPSLPFQACNAVAGTTYRNITFKDITIRNPQGSPGVIMGGGRDAPIVNLTFDNVQVILDDSVADLSPTELQSLFPSLTYPINDEDAWGTVVGVYAFVVLVVVAIAVAYQLHKRKRRKVYESRVPREIQPLPTTEMTREEDGAVVAELRSTGQDSDSRRQRPQRQRRQQRRRLVPASLLKCLRLCSMVFLTVGIVLATIQLVYMIFLIPNVNSQEHYFACEGVINGVAKGNTTPVPPCFDDQTTKSTAPPAVYVIGLVRKQVVVGILLFLFWFLYLTTMQRLRRKTQSRRGGRGRTTSSSSQGDGIYRDSEHGTGGGDFDNDGNDDDGHDDQSDHSDADEKNSVGSDGSHNSRSSQHREQISGVAPPPGVFSEAFGAAAAESTDGPPAGIAVPTTTVVDTPVSDDEKA